MNYKKTHKFRLIDISYNLNKQYKLIFGNYGIKSMNTGLINQKHLENLRRKLSKQFKKLNNINKSKLFIRIHLWKAFTSKPMLSRMGKGAGVVCNWMALIKPGFILLEILTSKENLDVLKIIKRAISTFPLKLVLIKKN